MEQLAEQIAHTFYDYHNYDNFTFDSSRVLTWVDQFESSNQQFILEELLFLLKKGLYVSESKARDLLIDRIEKLSSFFGFKKPELFLVHVHFLRLQPAEKSQDVLLKLLGQEMKKRYNFELSDCGKESAKYAIYIDDILATGGTVFNDCHVWLQIKNNDGMSNLDKILKREKMLIVSVFCTHNWAQGNIDWRLKLFFETNDILNKIKYVFDYEIQNHPTFQNQRLNFTYPVADQPRLVKEYFDKLPMTIKGEHAFRKPKLPVRETLFSSAENRTRFENILLQTGVLLLESATTLKHNHRPLGATFPSYKTLGTGTLFFTWRNISNTSPIVFWWKVNWFPLFPLYKRGIGNVRDGY